MLIFTITETAQMVGVSTSTLRRWEDENRLSFDVERNSSGVRVYTHSQVKELQNLNIEIKPYLKDCEISHNPSRVEIDMNNKLSIQMHNELMSLDIQRNNWS